MLTQMYVWLSSYVATLKQEEGQGMAEYGLLLALIAVVVIAAAFFLGGEIDSLFRTVGGILTDPEAAAAGG